MTKTTDAQQRLEAITRLGSEPGLAGAEVGIAVDDGVATLYGRVEDRDQKLAAERAVLKVPGILAIAVEVTEEAHGSRRHGDTDMARAIAEYLRNEHLQPVDAVRARVEQARVTLSGEVDLFHQRDALERGIRNLPGVRGVVNLVSVRPPESQSDIHAKVRSAVSRELASLDPDAAPERWRSEGGATMKKGKTILVIDDDDDFRASVKPVLEGAGYVVLECRSGHEGLEQLLAHEPDVIVLDIMMETNEEGYGVNQAIKYADEYKRFRGIPIVMVSSIQETPDERFPRAAELEMIQPDAYLTKPLDIDRFLAVVERAAMRKVRA